MLRSIIRFSLRSPLFVVALAVVLIVAGVFRLRRMPVDVLRERRSQERGGGLFRILWAFVVLIVLYVGSVGPVVKWGRTARSTPALGAFYAPLRFLSDRSSAVKHFLDWYVVDVWKAYAGKRI